MDVVRTVSSAADTSGAPSPNQENSNHAVAIGNNDSLHTMNESSARAVIAPEESAAAATVEQEDGPMPIPPEPATQGEDEEDIAGEEDDDEEDYEYEYEDEDEAAFGGFLQVDNPPPVAVGGTGETSAAAAAPAKIEEEEQQQQNPSEEDAPPVEAHDSHAKKAQWREPSREAVNMSLRAEKETSGSKRRLAQDLYRIMNKDTEETGFSLKPSKEDSMDKWTIKLFQFDNDSNLAKDMLVLGLEAIELEMSFPNQYPFEPPFVRVVQPRFKRQTGFVMNGAICMELLTKEGWNPVNDIESVIVSVRSLLVVGEGRLEAAFNLPETKYKSLLETAQAVKAAAEENEAAAAEEEEDEDDQDRKRQRKNSAGDAVSMQRQRDELSEQQRRLLRSEKSSSYSEADAKAAYEHLSSYHKKKGWDTSGWWARKG
eukprot:CAMPEP_0172440236 /NCGR_PEP_ID=MMETSP1065-20121228/933_1 /TAXON_ID=265537 /ORGANISM="Amphiprora paludosa, Strain CCMP125" /LENGTH=427 /DNA_ID=CAMNT_0013189021 /DNA_START=270 /DNA_END=1553 /DNA_ORIENTATION=-